MASNQQPIKIEVKAEPKATPEYKVIVPENREKKRYSILQFNGPLNVDPGHWPQMQLMMAREDNRAHTIGPSEIVQDFGEGSEYGRAAREEARRKKYGRQARTYHHDRQPWQLMIKNPSNANVKDRVYRSVCEGGAGAHSDYWVFLKSGNNFHAHKVDDWYRFMPNLQRKGLDMDQIEEQFLNRNKVLNQFALKAQIQKLKDQGDDDGGKIAKPTSLVNEASSDEEDADPESRRNNGDDEEDGSRQSTNKKKPNKKTKNGDNKRKDKRQRVDNADEVAAYESEDGQDEGREYDYISDSGSNTSREEMTVDEKVDKELVAVGDETGMRDDASDEESDDDEEEEGEDETTKQRRKLVKKLNEKKDAKADEEPKIQITDKVDKRDSSGSDTDDPDNPESRTSVLFMQAKARKRPLDGETTNGDSKRTKNDSREQTPSSSTQQSSGDSQQNGFNEETVRRLLIQRPYSTKELVGKFKTKNPNMPKEEIVARLVEILHVLKPEQISREINKKKVLYFSLSKN